MMRSRMLRTVLTTLLACASALSVHAQEGAPQSFARIAKEGARILNLADDKGKAVAEPSVGDLVAIYEENQSGWLSVEVPGGYAVWVFGKFLKDTDEEQVFEVTRNAVNIRPGPSSEVVNFPLPQRLHAGDRVHLIEVLDTEAPLAETWARVWSPPGVRAWLRKDAVAALDVREDGLALWNAALAQAADRVLEPMKPVEAAAATKTEGAGTTEAPEGDAKSELAKAQDELEKERSREAPDFARVRGLVEAVIERTPTGPTAIQARQTLLRIDALEEGAKLEAELQTVRADRAAKAMEEQRRVWSESRRKDPLGGVFASRGVLFRRKDVDGVPQYFLRFGGETVAELYCPSGRYDLELFAGFEVGVQGTPFLSEGERTTPALEISRLEVLRRR